MDIEFIRISPDDVAPGDYVFNFDDDGKLHYFEFVESVDENSNVFVSFSSEEGILEGSEKLLPVFYRIVVKAGDINMVNDFVDPIKFPILEPFPVNEDKTYKKLALKVLEEASELVESVKSRDYSSTGEELLDVYQALGNLVHELGMEADLEYFYEKVHEKNFDRGRYESD